MTTHPAIDNNKVKSILDDPYEPSPKIMAIKYIREVTGWLLSESKEWLDNFISTLQSQTGTITWHSIAEGHVPLVDTEPGFYQENSYSAECLIYFEVNGDKRAGTGRCNLKINHWVHNIGNVMPTHFAYINYPE